MPFTGVLWPLPENFVSVYNAIHEKKAPGDYAKDLKKLRLNRHAPKFVPETHSRNRAIGMAVA
jgi:hypothetical protein